MMAAQLPSKYAYGSGDVGPGGDLVSPAERTFYGQTDSEIQDFLNSLHLGNPDRYGGAPAPDVFPEMDAPYRDPQDFIGRQMASATPVNEQYRDLDKRMAPNDLARVPGMIGGGTDSDVMNFLEETHTPGMSRDEPPPVFQGEEGPQGPTNPQEFIRQKLAGDVVPMRPLGSPQDVAATQRRLETPGFYPASRGAGAISQFGGPSSPYLDLLNVLSYPSGQQMNPAYRK
jgi:hypothetical protein